MKDIAGHPNLRMDAEYWVGKENGEKAHKKTDKGYLKEDDATGKVMVTPDERKKFNTTTNEIQKLKKKIKSLTDKIK